ncbi:MAG: hypothetical protein AAGG01_22035, partial [Planctomycetota bacterium]
MLIYRLCRAISAAFQDAPPRSHLVDKTSVPESAGAVLECSSVVIVNEDHLEDTLVAPHALPTSDLA